MSPAPEIQAAVVRQAHIHAVAAAPADQAIPGHRAADRQEADIPAVHLQAEAIPAVRVAVIPAAVHRHPAEVIPAVPAAVADIRAADIRAVAAIPEAADIPEAVPMAVAAVGKQ